MENKDWQRALELQKNHSHDEAVALFNDLIKEIKNNPDLYHDRGVSYFHLKQKRSSLADFETAANLQPDYAYRYSSMAFIKAAFKMTKEALEDYNKAVLLDPSDAVTQNNLGLLEEQMGWKKESEERFKVADELAGILKDSEIAPAPEQQKAVEEQIPKITPENNPTQTETQVSFVTIIFGIFKSKKQFAEFVHFLKNGFTFKKNKNTPQE